MNRIKHLRLLNNVSQSDLAAFLHVKPNTISRYENGVREPAIDIVIKMAEYFHVTTDILLGKDDRRLMGQPLDINEDKGGITHENHAGLPVRQYKKDNKIPLREIDDDKTRQAATSKKSDMEILNLYNKLDEPGRWMVKGYIHRLLEERDSR